MNRDDIIRMTHEAGLHLATEAHWMPIIDLVYAEKLVNLVAAAERKSIASMVEQMGIEGYGTLAIAAAIRAREKK